VPAGRRRARPGPPGAPPPGPPDRGRRGGAGRLTQAPWCRPVPGTADNKRVGLRSVLVKPVRWIWSVRGAMLVCGALLVLAFPDANLEFLAWLGLAPGRVLVVWSL